MALIVLQSAHAAIEKRDQPLRFEPSDATVMERMGRWAWASLPVFSAVVFCSLEVLRRPNTQGPGAWLLAVLLGLAVGAFFVALAAPFTKTAPMVLGPIAVALVPAARELWWAIARGHELSVRSVHAGTWATTLILLGLCALIVQRAVWARVGPLRARVYAGLFAVVALFPTLYFLQPYGFELAVTLTWGALFLFIGVLVRVRVARLLLAPLVALAVLSIGLFLPERYLTLHAALGAFGIALMSITGRTIAESRELKESPRRAYRAWVGLAAFAAFAGSAQAVCAASPKALRDAGPSRGLLTGILHVARRVSDFDADGHGIVFLERDCAPFDPEINPGQHEISGNQRDENCAAGPASEKPCDFIKRAQDRNGLPPEYRGDIILITVDTLRHDDALDPTLPAISDLVQNGVSFDRAYASASMTVEALPSLIGGFLPTTLPIEWLGPLAGKLLVPPGGLVPTLRELGYQTAFVGGGEHDELWLDQGVGQGIEQRKIFDQNASPQSVFDSARALFLGMSSDKPRFLWVHNMWVHKPWETHDEYKQSVRDVDAQIGKLRAAINTPAMWILSSDHGDEFFEHGRRYHGSTLYVESVHVPLIMSWPGGPRGRVASVSPTRALYPTVIAMVSPTHRTHTKGPYLCLGQAECVDLPAPLALETKHAHLHGLIEGRYHIIEDMFTGRIEAFDMLKDPREENALKVVPKALRDSLSAWVEHAYGVQDPGSFWPYTSAGCVKSRPSMP